MVGAGQVMIVNAASVISAGTEKIVIDFARKSLLDKARERPDQVRRLWEKVRQEGLASAVRAARTRLDEPMAMGYASAGVVLEVGEGVQGFKPGDQVASNGPHAGVVCVPKNLCASVPNGVPLEHAAFTVLGAIALQGVRLSRAALGETVFVIGLGLVGQLTVSLLKAAGCRVVGTDLDGSRCDLAIKMGATLARPELAASDVAAITGGLGADAVIITASTKSKGPIDLAANAVRQKGRVVLVGVVGLELDRRPFYFKEAEFVVSCSYGPGRYDPAYEEGGHDYPPAYVRWTEQRNMQAVLDLMAGGTLDVSPLITHRLPIEEAERAYDLIERGRRALPGHRAPVSVCGAGTVGATDQAGGSETHHRQDRYRRPRCGEFRPDDFAARAQKARRSCGRSRSVRRAASPPRTTVPNLASRSRRRTRMRSSAIRTWMPCSFSPATTSTRAR